jgi:CRP-like cAMP-binding protein/class 3 adenylate cyclase
MLLRVFEPTSPSPDPASGLADLRERLKRLHRKAGEPSTRAIGKAITLSHTTVHSVLRCSKAPVWGQLELVVESLGGEVEEFKELWIAAKDEEEKLNNIVNGDVPETPQRADREQDYGGAVAYDVIIVSCDIVGHSSEASHAIQRRRIAELNRIVARTIEEHGNYAIIWLSGGDGGHIVFRDISDVRPWWRQPVIELIRRLLDWSRNEGWRLRIAGHASSATHLPGADGRIQPVGDGINVAGWLLTRGGPDGIVVTEPFRDRIENAGPIDTIAFHEPRVLPDKKRAEQQLMLMSFDDYRSMWSLPVNEDREQLRNALKLLDGPVEPGVQGPQRHGWEVLLYAKRILQVNKRDPEARQALGRLNRLDLQCRTDDGRIGLNPFFEDLDPTLLRQVVESADVVHRGYNEVLCRMGDAGDTMFVILKGRVGVYKRPADQLDEGSIEPRSSHEEGEVVGELAFALAGNRTADVVALTETLLLAFNYDQIIKLLPDDGTSSKDGIRAQVETRVSKFITHRVLQHVSERAPFLVGPTGTGPLTKGVEPVSQTLASLSWYCKLIRLDRNRPITLETASPDAQAGGIYLLAAGSLKDESGHIVSAADFPILWAVLPGVAAGPASRFSANSDEIKVLCIGADGLENLELEKLLDLRAKVVAYILRG